MDSLDAAQMVVGRFVDPRALGMGGDRIRRVRPERHLPAREPRAVGRPRWDHRHAAVDCGHDPIGGGGGDGGGPDHVPESAPDQRASYGGWTERTLSGGSYPPAVNRSRIKLLTGLAGICEWS